MATVVVDANVFRDLLNEIVKRSGLTKRAFAGEIGITPWAFSRIGAGNCSVPICLSIADVGRTDASIVLRAAGHHDTAARIERLYGTVRREPRITPHQKRVLHWLLSLDPAFRTHFETLIELAATQMPAPRIVSVRPRRQKRRIHHAA